ncbi:MAG: mechanosensitive ion channel [Duncaniella sp.]|nr:mechanosensitive ion channel [Duncaniella sp.]
MLNLEIIPSHSVATWLLGNIHRFLDFIGLEHEKNIEEIIYVATIIAASIAIGWVIRQIILYLARTIVGWRKNQLAQEILQHHILTKCSHIIPPLVMLALIPFALVGSSFLNTVIMRALLVYTSVVFTVALTSVIKFIWLRFDETRNTKNLPIKGIYDTVVGVLWVLTAIVVIAIIVGKSPGSLLAGLGAFAAVLMLVFKDSILGLVAGLQLSQNDELRVGDWIVVPSTIANGTVIDVSLTTVKIQNWDNTIVTLPPYTLVSGSFQNWRGMQESGGRQISRQFLVDYYSVAQTTPEQVEQAKTDFPRLAPYIEHLQKLGHNDYAGGTAVMNGTIDTNLGLFRAYLYSWLIDNDAIRKDMEILVRLMPPTEYGVPLQVYCFTATTVWSAYEAIQGAVMEHVIAMAPKFGIRLYNETSGADVTSINILQDERMIEKELSEDAKKAAAIPASSTPAASTAPAAPTASK